MKYITKKTKLGFLEGKPELWKVQRLTMATVSEQELIKYIANSSNVPQSTITACLMAISEAIAYFVINGHYVTFEDFGSFYLKMRAKVTPEKDDVKADLVKSTTIGFTASSNLSEIVNNTGLERMDSLSSTNC